MRAESNIGGLLSLNSRLLNNELDKLFISKGVEVTREQWVLLLELEIGENKTPVALANRMMKARGAITQLIKGLERAEMVEKHHDEKDGRSYSVALTSRGLEAVGRGKEVAIGCLGRTLEGFSESEKVQFLFLLNKLLDTLK